MTAQKYLALAVLMCCGVVHANSLLEDVAITALKATVTSPSYTEHEHGGMIYWHQTDYGRVLEYLEPNVGSSTTWVTVIDKAQLGQDDVLVATYHTHLCLETYLHDLFSVTDVFGAIIHGIPEFMLDECTGLVHEFNPATMRVKDTGRDVTIATPDGAGKDVHLPSGKIIGDIGHTEPERSIRE